MVLQRKRRIKLSAYYQSTQYSNVLIFFFIEEFYQLPEPELGQYLEQLIFLGDADTLQMVVESFLNVTHIGPRHSVGLYPRLPVVKLFR